MKYFFVSTVSMIVVGMIFTYSAFALTVSPAKLELSGDPGTTITGEVELLNEQDSIETLYSSFSNFDSNGDSGAPHFIGANDDLATWIKTDSQVILNPGEKKTIPFSINIPSDAQLGGHFAAIFFGTQSPGSQNGGEVSIGGKLGILVFLRVSGDVKEGGGVLDFSTKENQKIFSTMPVIFEYRINNTGGDRIVPKGEIIIKNLSLLTSATLDANEKKGSVLPGSMRKFEVVWGKEKEVIISGFFTMAAKEFQDFHIGWYQVNLNVMLGQNNQSTSKTLSFFIVPWQLLVILLVILLTAGVLGFFSIRKYNRWIISRANQYKQ